MKLLSFVIFSFCLTITLALFENDDDDCEPPCKHCCIVGQCGTKEECYQELISELTFFGILVGAMLLGWLIARLIIRWCERRRRQNPLLE